MNLGLLSLYILTLLLLIATPGPVVALVIHTGIQKGFRQGLLTILGTNAASLVLIGAALLILSGLLTLSQQSLQWITLAGCLFILWLAMQALRTRPQTATSEPLPSQSRPALLAGLLTGIANPKDIIFFAAFFPQFISITPNPATSLTLLILLWILFDFLILIGYLKLLESRLLQARKDQITRLSAWALLMVGLLGLIRTGLALLQ